MSTLKPIPKALVLNSKYYSSEELMMLASSLQAPDKSEWEASLGRFLEQWTDENETISVKTSGSTGVPKLATLKKQAMLTSASMTIDFLGLREGQNALLCLNAGYIAGMMMVVRAISCKMNLITVPPDGSPLDHISEKTIIDFAAMVPAQVYNAAGNRESMQTLESIGTLIIGGAPTDPELEKILGGMKGKIYATFGMTETITHIALRRLNGPQRNDKFTVLPGVTIETDDRGCLVAGLPYLEGGKILTNDLVSIVSPETFLWLGRADNVINSGGIKLIPEAIERKITLRIEQRFFIASRPDAKLGEIPVLVIETENPLSVIEKDQLSERIKPWLSRAEMPRQIYCSGRFIEAGNGKINRKESLENARIV